MTILSQQARTTTVPKQSTRTLLALLLLSVFLSIILIALHFFPLSTSLHPKSSEVIKSVALRLEGNSLPEVGADWLKRFLENSNHLSSEEQASLALRLGELYESHKNYEQAIGWFYFADELTKNHELKNKINPKIIATLETLKRFASARYELTQKSQAGSEPATTDNPLIAEVGDLKVKKSDIDKAFSKLPAEMAKEYSDPKKKEQFIHQYLAEQLLYRKAVRQGMDQTPEFRESEDDFRRAALLRKMLEEKIKGQAISETDIKNYYEAHKKDFNDKTFDEVKQQVQLRYSQEKMSTIYQQLLQEATATEKVSIFPESVEVKTK